MTYTITGAQIVRLFLEKIEEIDRMATNKAILKSLNMIAAHKNGHSVAKKFIELTKNFNYLAFIREFISINLKTLATSSFGNRVVQKYLATCSEPMDPVVIGIVREFIWFATAKFSSSLIATVYSLGIPKVCEQFDALIELGTVRNELAQSFHGNFVLEKLAKLKKKRQTQNR